MKKLFFILFLLSFNVAAENWYRVELIVFENSNSDPSGELWEKYPGLPDTGSSIKLTRAQQGGSSELIPFQTLDSSLLTLSGAYSKLKSSSLYNPLSYLAWQQPSLEARNARSVKVQIFNGVDELNVLGKLKIRSGVYLHADLDLAYSVSPGSLMIEEDNGGKIARLTESRRIKLNEIHYFDHPLFGAIVRVVRLNAE